MCLILALFAIRKGKVTQIPLCGFNRPALNLSVSILSRAETRRYCLRTTQTAAYLYHPALSSTREAGARAAFCFLQLSPTVPRPPSLHILGSYNVSIPLPQGLCTCCPSWHDSNATYQAISRLPEKVADPYLTLLTYLNLTTKHPL